MLNTCISCKKYSSEKQMTEDGNYMICPHCGHKQQIKKMPLFIITGASGVGKSTLSAQLFLKEKDYIVMESDILWCDAFNEPENNYRKYRELWLRVCKNISQVGKPVVLCGCSIPEQFEDCIERRYFSNIYYLAVVADDAVLEKRLREGRGYEDKEYISQCLSFNSWLKNNADSTTPKLTLLDNSESDLEKSVRITEEWIYKNLERESI